MKNKIIAIILILIISITNLFTYVLADTIDSMKVVGEDGVLVLFKDVKSDAWYASYLTSLAEKKIVEGYDDGTL